MIRWRILAYEVQGHPLHDVHAELEMGEEQVLGILCVCRMTYRYLLYVSMPEMTRSFQ